MSTAYDEPTSLSLGANYRKVWSSAAASNLADGIFQIALPLIAACVAYSPNELIDALRLSLKAPSDAPAETREDAASLLRTAGTLSLAAGAIGSLGSIIALLNWSAATGGSRN